MGPGDRLLFVGLARLGSPVVRRAYGDPFVGKPASGVLTTAVGVPRGGTATKDAPVTSDASADKAWASCRADAVASMPIAA